MGYPTDVRAQRAYAFRGINAKWDEEGTPLAHNETATVVNVSGKAGKIIGARLISKHENIHMNILCDGINMNDAYRQSAAYLMATYGCCMPCGLVRVVRYDTVNSKYIFDLAQPIEFGDSLVVQLQNITGAAQRCACDVQWIENT